MNTQKNKLIPKTVQMFFNKYGNTICTSYRDICLDQSKSAAFTLAVFQRVREYFAVIPDEFIDEDFIKAVTRNISYDEFKKIRPDLANDFSYKGAL